MRRTYGLCSIVRPSLNSAHWHFGAAVRSRIPTAADALAITRSLRVEGNLAAQRLAEQIEEACRAAD